MKIRKLLISLVFGLFLVIILSNYYNTKIKKDEIQLYIEKVNHIASKLFKNKDNLKKQISEANYLLEDIQYRMSYIKDPEKILKLKNLAENLINKKSKFIVYAFIEQEKNKGVFEKFSYSNQEALENFKKNLHNYLQNVYKKNKERFIGEILSYTSMYKFIKSKNKEEYIKKAYKESFLSPEMLQDAIKTYYEQYLFDIEANINNYMVEILKDFVLFANSLDGNINFPEPRKIYEQINLENVLNDTYNDISVNLNRKDIEKISALISKSVASEIVTTGLSLFPGVGWVSSVFLEGGNYLLQKKFAKSIEGILHKSVEDMYISIWDGKTGYGKKLMHVNNNLESNTIKITEKELIIFLESLDRKKYLGDRKL